MKTDPAKRHSWVFQIAAITPLLFSSGSWAADPTIPVDRVIPPQQIHIVVVQRGAVHIDATLIPQIGAEMPLLQLSTASPPLPYIHQLMQRSRPVSGGGKFEMMRRIGSPPAQVAPLAPQPENLMVSREKGNVVAYVDVKSGNFEIVPALQTLKPIKLDPAVGSRTAAGVFGRADFLPKDDTRYVVGKSVALYGETLVRPGAKSTFKANSKQPYLMFVAAQRFVGDYPVFGPGSRVTVAVDDHETVHGVVHRWKVGHIIDHVKPTLSADQVVAAIKAQLEPSTAGADVTVDGVTMGYYDGNAQYLQPVYRFTATIHATGGQSSPVLADDHVVGYVPVADTREPIPSLASKPAVMPQTPMGKGAPPMHMPPLGLNDPTVGRYVVRNDDPNWVADANEFWSGLSFLWFAPNFTNSQYFWGEPWMYTSSSNAFANSVNVALTEGHGDWWLFTTLQNCCGAVDITALPAGFGSATGGQMRFWTIHSCEVVPSPDDTPNWANPWWNVFQGLHTVVGYRTIMYIDDDVEVPYGINLALGMPVVTSWLSTVHASSAYSGNPTAQAHGGITRPMGRPTAIAACGHENDNIYNTTNIGPASCLRVFWYPD